MLVFATLALADSVAVLRAEGCLACHDAGSAAGIGPPLGTLSGATRTVQRGAEVLNVKVDADYVTRAMIAPDVELVQGYPAGIMPAVDPQRAEELLPHLAALKPDAAPPRGGILPVAAWALTFCLGHVVLSARAIRDPMRKALGTAAFLSVYSAVIAVPFFGLLWAWSVAEYAPLWLPVPWTRLVPLATMPLVTILLVSGLTTPNPTLIGREDALATTLEPHGIYRVTRHPLAVAAVLWGASHLAPNGDVAAVFLFGAVALVGVLGALHLDRRLAISHGDAWRRYAAQTSILPFAAILTGRARLHFEEIGPLRIFGGVVAFAFLLFLHTWIVGASPFPVGL